MPPRTRVPGAATISNIEHLLNGIAAEPATPLLLPTNFHHGTLGGQAALLQAVGTWAAQHTAPALHTYILPTKTDQDVKRLFKHDVAVMAALMTGTWLANDGTTHLSADIAGALKMRMTAMRHITTARIGTRVFLACKDRAPEFPIPDLYEDDEKHRLKPLDTFTWLTRQLFTSTIQAWSRSAAVKEVQQDQLGLFSSAPQDQDNERGPQQDFLDLGNILFELFENTHKWAQFDLDGIPLDPGKSVRAVRFELQQGTVQDLKTQTIDAPALHAYVGHPVFATPKHYFQRFLEISILDTGPGLAARRQGSHLPAIVTAPEEYDLITACLKLHGTSSARTHRGKGLHEVMKLLTRRKGFLRLRTGRLSLQRDFLAKPYAHAAVENGTVTDEPYLLDWSGEQNLHQYAPTRGALFTLLLPIPAPPEAP